MCDFTLDLGDRCNEPAICTFTQLCIILLSNIVVLKIRSEV